MILICCWYYYRTLSLKVNYRTNCDFHIDASAEEILSYNFMVDFDEQFFTPTVAKYNQEQEQKKQTGKDERRKSVPTRMNVSIQRLLLWYINVNYRVYI